MNTSVLSPALRASPWWPRLAALAAALLLALALVRLLWLLLSGPSLPMQDIDSAAPPQAMGGAPLAAPIAQWHLFGNAMPMQPANQASAPETALALFLRGTLNEDAEGRGIAIIADAEGGERAYRVGDQLPGGAELTAVHAGRVLLSRDGVTEQLSLPREQAPGSGPGSTQASAGRSAGSPAPGRINALIQPGATPPGFVNPMISTGGPQIDAATRAALPDLATLAQQVNVLPVIENGRVAGVRLAAGRDSGLLAKTGIRPTDIVTAVNGIPLDGPQRQQQLLETLRSGGSVQVTVRRDGRETQIPVDLR